MGPVFPPVLYQNTCTPTFDESIHDIPEERDDAGLGHIAPGNVLRRLNERLWCVVVLAQRNVEVPASAFLHVLHLVPSRRSLTLILIAGSTTRRVASWSPPTSGANAAWRVILPYVGWPPIVSTMALDPEKFYDHAVAAADDECRLPLSRMTGWDVSPFEPDGLRVSPLRPPVLPEPARQGEDPSDCVACTRRDEGIWFDARWRLTQMTGVGVPLVLMLHPRDHFDLVDLPDEMAAEFGVLSTHVARHVKSLPNVARAHVYVLGDGGAHLHVGPPRPGAQDASLVVGRHIAEYPADIAEADAANRGRRAGRLLRRRSSGSLTRPGGSRILEVRAQ